MSLKKEFKCITSSTISIRLIDLNKPVVCGWMIAIYIYRGCAKILVSQLYEKGTTYKY